jgi:hypothetical protein
MPLTGKSAITDRNLLLRRRFDARRRAALREAVGPEVVEEFRNDVIGRAPRTLVLRHLLNFMRMSPIEGRPFAYAAPSYRAYYLARLHAERGNPPTVDTSQTFDTKEDAVVAAFVERLTAITDTYPEADEK